MLILPSLLSAVVACEVLLRALSNLAGTAAAVSCLIVGGFGTSLLVDK